MWDYKDRVATLGTFRLLLFFTMLKTHIGYKNVQYRVSYIYIYIYILVNLMIFFLFHQLYKHTWAKRTQNFQSKDYILWVLFNFRNIWIKNNAPYKINHSFEWTKHKVKKELFVKPEVVTVNIHDVHITNSLFPY